MSVNRKVNMPDGRLCIENSFTVYHTGVKLSKEAMALVEGQLRRDSALGKWFIDIVPTPDLE
jgi:hypothetical protein